MNAVNTAELMNTLGQQAKAASALMAKASAARKAAALRASPTAHREAETAKAHRG